MTPQGCHTKYIRNTKAEIHYLGVNSLQGVVQIESLFDLSCLFGGVQSELDLNLGPPEYKSSTQTPRVHCLLTIIFVN